MLDINPFKLTEYALRPVFRIAYSVSLEHHQQVFEMTHLERG
jgi:hypothetical protein